jgi:hypothetical protein
MLSLDDFLARSMRDGEGGEVASWEAAIGCQGSMQPAAAHCRTRTSRLL